MCGLLGKRGVCGEGGATGGGGDERDVHPVCDKALGRGLRAKELGRAAPYNKLMGIFWMGLMI